MVRSRFRDDGGIRWWEMEDFTVQTCWRVWRGAGSTVVPFDNFKEQQMVGAKNISSAWERGVRVPRRGGFEYPGEGG